MTNNSIASAEIIPFRNKQLLLVDRGGEPFVPMKPVVDGMGLDWKSQYAKLQGGRFNSTMVMITTVAGDGKRREMACLPLRKLAGWLMSIHASKVRPDLREGVIAYQNECDDALWAYWNDGIAARGDCRKGLDLIGSVIGTSGVNVLDRVIDQKAGVIAKGLRRSFRHTIKSRLRSRFNVQRTDLIPADELANACNFVAAYALDGEWLGKEPAPQGVFMSDHDLYSVWFLAQHFEHLRDIYRQWDLYRTLSALGSPIGVEMRAHFNDGGGVAVYLADKYADEIDEYKRRNGICEYRGRAAA